MLKPTELSLEEMGDLAEIIPAADPEVKVSYQAIPRFDEPSRRSIIPVCEPTLRGNELKYVQQAVETNWISSAGSFIRDFEAQFAAYCGTTIWHRLRQRHGGHASGPGDAGLGAGRRSHPARRSP